MVEQFDLQPTRRMIVETLEELSGINKSGAYFSKEAILYFDGRFKKTDLEVFNHALDSLSSEGRIGNELIVSNITPKESYQVYRSRK